MASQKIKGITIEIGGDTSKLGKALEASEKQTRSLQGELKQINKLLNEGDPKNVELLAQKQAVLTSEIEETSKKLELLREAERQVTEQFKQGKVSEDQVRALQREIIKAESSLSSAKNELKETNTALENADDSAEDLDRSLEDLEGSSKKAGDGFSVMKGALANLVADGIQAASGAVKDFAKESIKTGMDFESAMAEVAAISGATGEDLKLLEDTAKKYGATTVFSASESAAALKYMSLAGWDAKQSADALGSVLNLAAASGMDLAQASDIVTDYLSAFGMQAKDSTYFADMLAYAQANSNTSVDQLAEAYRNCAAVLNASGQDVETTTSLLAQMANQGFKGSEAGTALTAIMRDMTAKMKDGSIMVGKTAIAVQDANGNYRDMTDILKDVEKATDGMGEAERATALATTFTADSTKGLSLLLNAGVGSAEDFEKALRDAGGTADKMGDIMNDNANGDVKAMKSALEDLQISLYDELQPSIRDIVQTITTDVIPVLKNTLIPAIKDFLNFILNNGDAILATISGIGAAFLVWNVATMINGVVTAIKAFKLANEGATVAQWLFNAAMNANPLVLVATLVAALVAAIVTFIATNDDARAKFIEVWEGIQEKAKAVIDAIVGFFSGVIDWVKENWQGLLLFLVNPFAGAFKLIYDNCEVFRNFVDNFVATIKEFFVNLGNSIADKAREIWSKIVEIFTPAIEFFSAIFSSIYNTLSSIVSVIIEILKGCWEIIKAVFSIVASWFNEHVLEPVKKAFDTAWKAISGFASSAWDAIKKVWNVVSGWFNDKIISPVSKIFSSMWDSLKNGASKAWSGIKSVFSSCAEFFRSTFETAWKKVKDVFSTGGKIFDGIKEGIVSAFTSIVNAIIRGVNKVVAVPFKGINDVLDKLRSFEILEMKPFKGIGSITVPKIPELARGGILKRGQMGLLEGDGAEAVVPLEKNTEWTRNVARQINEFKDQNRSSYDNALLRRLEDIYKKLDKLKQNIVLDSGVLVGETIDQIDERLATTYSMKARGI